MRVTLAIRIVAMIASANGAVAGDYRRTTRLK